MPLVIAVEAAPQFRRGALMCHKRIGPPLVEGGYPMLQYVAGRELGCIVLSISQQHPDIIASLGRPLHGDVEVNGTWYRGWDLSAHMPRPRPGAEPGSPPTIDRCEFMDGMACWSDGSSLQAELAYYFESWVLPAADPPVAVAPAGGSAREADQ